jgi:hypothetical protein
MTEKVHLWTDSKYTKSLQMSNEKQDMEAKDMPNFKNQPFSPHQKYPFFSPSSWQRRIHFEPCQVSDGDKSGIVLKR